MTRVLIIDDDVDMTDMLKMVLGANGFEVFAANSSADGINAAMQWQPDLIILDQLMPVMHGWEVCKKIREFSQVPILILSVVNKPETIARTLDAGADDYLIKPVSNSVLIAQLQKLRRRAYVELSADALTR